MADRTTKTGGKSKRSLPNGAKEILQDFVVAVLRGRVEQEQFLRFAVEWFTRASKEEEQRKAEQPQSAGQKPSRNELSDSSRSATTVKQPSKSTLEPVGSAIQPTQSRTTLPQTPDERQSSLNAGRSQTNLTVKGSTQERPASAKSAQNVDVNKSELAHRPVTPSSSRNTLEAQKDAEKVPSGMDVGKAPSRVPSAAGARSTHEVPHDEPTRDPSRHDMPQSQPSTLEPKSRTTLEANNNPSRQNVPQSSPSSHENKSRTTLEANKSQHPLDTAKSGANLQESKSRGTLEETKGPSRTTLEGQPSEAKSRSTLEAQQPTGGPSRSTLEAGKSRTTLEAAKSGTDVHAAKSSASVNQHPENPQESPKDPQLESRRQAVSAESYDPAAESDVPDKVFPKTDEQLHRVKEAVKEVLLFRSLDEDHLRKVIDALEEVKVEAGEEVIRIGDEKAEHFYVIEDGEFDCFAKVNGELTKVTEYVNRGSFGELALMYNQPRAATVRARTSGKLWQLDRETFKRIIVRGAYEKRKLYMSLMEKVDFLADLQDYEKQNVCDALVPRKYSAGEVVMKQGDQGDGMYFVESGEVVCSRNEEGNDQEVGRAGPGQYVGELALIAGQPRAATVVATADGTKLAFLDSKAFERLMGPCIDILRKNGDRYKDKIIAVFGENSAYLHDHATA